VAPANPGTWLSAMAFAPDSGVGRRVPETADASQLALKGAREVLQRPLPTLGWMVQVLTRLAEVTDSYVRNELPTAVNTPGPWVSRPVTAAVSGAGKQT
jgi:hypothetical protein